jgi:hypothetical protein
MAVREGNPLNLHFELIFGIHKLEAALNPCHGTTEMPKIHATERGVS